MPSPAPAPDVLTPARLLDAARAALRTTRPDPTASTTRAERTRRRNQARADRAHRLAVARFGAYPAGRNAAALHPGGWGA